MKLARFSAVYLASVLGCSGSSTEPSSGPPSATASPQTSGGAQDHSGGQNARSTTPNPTLGAFGASCDAGAACVSAVCFEGGKGGFCSLTCTADTDCPQPSLGAPHCNPHGYCRY